MHPTAQHNFLLFLLKYVVPYVGSELRAAELSGDISVFESRIFSFIDTGSYDVNGTLKQVIERSIPRYKWTYTGVDMCKGRNVDIVVNASEMSQIITEKYDFVVSSSCFEHDEMFWLTFLEMIKICKPGGYIYINAPSAGGYHGFPGDCYRFYKDSWKGLERWGKKNGFSIELIETYIDPIPIWKDSVGIYRISEVISESK